LVLAYMAAEIVGGVASGSLALLADAGHMFSDAGALGLALFALWFARRPSTARYTFGYYRTEILAALVNGATLVAIALYILVEAYHRLQQPPEVQATTMTAIATGGLLVNVASLWILQGGREESLNVRGAWLHVFTDLLGSVQAVVAGGLIWVFGWNWADPVASILIGILVIVSSWSLLKESVSVLMQSAPSRIDMDELREAILGLDGVLGICDLRVWTVTTGVESMSAHVIVRDGTMSGALLQVIRDRVHDGFGIKHVTIQLEPEGFEEPDSGL
jgi:cobalt-zinc-cadmium efflux system protein